MRLLGTPAEERGGGKELMAREGAFKGVDAAMMMHPGDYNRLNGKVLACAHLKVTYHGKAAQPLPAHGMASMRWMGSSSPIRRSRRCVSTLGPLNAFMASSPMAAQVRIYCRVILALAIILVR